MEINDVYLVQRAKMKDGVKDADVVGYDSAFSNSYMGSSEYEWGALPASLKGILPQLDKYKVFQHKAIKHPDGRGVFVFCKPEMKDDLFKVLELMLLHGDYWYNGKNMVFRLKEAAYFNRVLKGEKGYDLDTNLWWDLGNNWFAGLGKPVIVRLELALKRLKEKWVKEGKIKA